MASGLPQTSQQSAPHMDQEDPHNGGGPATEPSPGSSNLPNIAESGVLVDTPQEMPSTSAQGNANKADESASERAEPRHCWICLQDEGIDSPESSQWRSPCPCNLQAHEECLLEWITDVQATSGAGSTPLSQKILCPQCKSEIKVKRPLELVVAVTHLVSLIGRQLVIPTGASMIIGCLYSGSMVYGFNAIELVFGAEGARELLFAGGNSPSMIREVIPDSFMNWFYTIMRLTDPFVPTAGGGSWVFGVSPLIAPALLLSRTRIADRTFSLLPILYLMFPQNQQIPEWPPSPGLALATLPYIRSAYNELYATVFGEREKAWDLAVQRRPREGETPQDVAHREEARANAEDNILGIEVEIINIEEGALHGEENLPHPPHPPVIHLLDQDGHPVHPDVQAPDGERPQVDQPEEGRPQPQDGEAQAAHPPQAGHPQPPAAQPNMDPAARAENWEFRQNISAAHVARTMIGALFFPAASSLMGDLLFRALPAAWVVKPMKRYSLQALPATGLLQEKWGRSLVGGCLFVVLRDALTLYCKWRNAKNQGKMRVLDYVRKEKKRERKEKKEKKEARSEQTASAEQTAR